MGPAAIPIIAIGSATTAAVVHERNESRREAREERERMERLAREAEERRIREEAEKKRQFEEQKKRQEEERKRLEEEIKRQKQLEQERIEKLKREKELEEKKRQEELAKKERIKKQKIAEAQNSYDNEKKNYENQKLNQIVNDFKNSEKNKFCSKQANQIEDLIKNKVGAIFKDFDENIKRKGKEIYESNLERIKNEKDNKYRILIIGRSGVGKSTLINAIFDFDLAETGIGRPITMCQKPKKYEYYNREELELFDTRGIELDPNYGIQKTSKMVEDFIGEQLKNKEPIKGIWYCVTGTKIEDIELNLIKKIRSLYKDDSLPVIIVYTQCTDDTIFSQFENYLNSQLNNQVKIKKILAKMKNINGIDCKRYGLEELINETKNIIDKNNDLLAICTAKAETEEKMNNILSEEININNSFNFEQKIEKIISSYFQRFGEPSLVQNITNAIKLLNNKYTEKLNIIIKNNLEEIASREAQKMKLDLSNILTKVINTHGNIISIDQNQYFNDYKIQIIQKLSNIAHEFGMNNLNPVAEKTLKDVIEMNIKSKIKSFISSI